MNTEFGIENLLAAEMREYIRHWLAGVGAPVAQQEAPAQQESPAQQETLAPPPIRLPKRWTYRETVHSPHQRPQQISRIKRINTIAESCERSGDRMAQASREDADTFISALRIDFTFAVTDSQECPQSLNGLVNDIAPELIGGGVDVLGRELLRRDINRLRLSPSHRNDISTFETICYHIKYLLLNIRLNVYNATRNGADRAAAVVAAITKAHGQLESYVAHYNRSIIFRVLSPLK